ncbi:MAG: hypothetical protein ABSB66_12510 [Candidatus Acidiferrales bacterium]
MTPHRLFPHTNCARPIRKSWTLHFSPNIAPQTPNSRSIAAACSLKSFPTLPPNIEAYGTRALLLNPQGHILAELEVYALAEKLLVRTHASVRERTFATLDKFIIMDDVTLEDLTDQLGSFAVEGPQAGTVIAQACGLALEGFSEFANAELPIDGVPSHLIRLSHFGGTGAEIWPRSTRFASKPESPGSPTISTTR